jgi:hypothetical protein
MIHDAFAQLNATAEPATQALNTHTVFTAMTEALLNEWFAQWASSNEFPASSGELDLQAAVRLLAREARTLPAVAALGLNQADKSALVEFLIYTTGGIIAGVEEDRPVVFPGV